MSISQSSPILEHIKKWSATNQQSNICGKCFFSTFNSGKSAADSYRLLFETYPNHVPNEATCRRRFVRFRNGYFGVKDKERPGQVKKFEDESLEVILDHDPCQTQSQLAELLGVSVMAISKCLKKLNNRNKTKTHTHLNSIYPKSLLRIS